MSLFGFISEMKLKQTTAILPLARHDTCHAVLDSIALRKHDIQRLFLICAKKNANSNLHVMGVICHWMSNLSFFPCTFTITDLSDSRRNPPQNGSNCLWFVYSSYPLLNLSFLIWPSELRSQHCTRTVLHQFQRKSRYHKTSRYIYICQIFLSPKKSPNEKFQNKKEYLYHLGNFNSPLSTSNVRLEPGIESNSIVCAFLFGSG